MLAAFPLLSFSPPVLDWIKSRLYCWYFVTLARLLLLPCYYPYKKQTILYIAADNVLDHDLILFRIYIYIALAVGFLRVMMGYFQDLSGWD